MKEIFVTGKTLPETYHKALISLYEDGEIVDCPDWNQKQIEASLTMEVLEPLTEPRISRLIIGGAHELQQYEMEVVDGILNFMIGKTDTTWEYSYSDRMINYNGFNQIDFVINELKRNPYSRRAVIIIRENAVNANITNPACAQHIQYFIRDNKLHCKIIFRSNDLAEANFYNCWGFIKLQEKIANELGIEVGTYTHRANSMHCYEKDFKLLEGYINGIKNRNIEDLTYNYTNEYKEIMEEEIPSIMGMVSDQKRKYNVH